MAWAGVATNIKSSCSPWIFTGHLCTQDNLVTALGLWGWLPRQWGQRGRSAQGPCDDGHQGHSPHCAGATFPHLAPPQTERTTATRFPGTRKLTMKPLEWTRSHGGGPLSHRPPAAAGSLRVSLAPPDTDGPVAPISPHAHGNSCNVPSLLTEDGLARASSS